MFIPMAAAESATLQTIATDIFKVAGQALTMITENPILLTFFGAGIVGIAISAIHSLKS